MKADIPEQGEGIGNMAKKEKTGAGEMAYRIKAIATKSDNPSLFPRNIMVEREGQFCQAILQPPYAHCGIDPFPEQADIILKL